MVLGWLRRKQTYTWGSFGGSRRALGAASAEPDVHLGWLGGSRRALGAASAEADALLGQLRRNQTYTWGSFGGTRRTLGVAWRKQTCSWGGFGGSRRALGAASTEAEVLLGRLWAEPGARYWPPLWNGPRSFRSGRSFFLGAFGRYYIMRHYQT
ncbi:hypothetical protein NYE69_09620 [Paenibacillus sp. FSL R5-0527]|uniref:hypothetical protein n=1 Tax=Paenibacillus sp. FSL R5-0527 TaxID=2975321 RepID=UPI0030F7AA7F